MFEQQTLFDAAPLSTETVRAARSGSFVDNMRLPVQRWFRYSAGFSADWVTSVLREHPCSRLIDPFAGSGTTLLAADALGIEAVGVEAHPFVVRVGQAKLKWRLADATLRDGVQEVAQQARSAKPRAPSASPALLHQCFEPQALEVLLRWRDAALDVAPSLDEGRAALIFLLLSAVLRECSFVGTAQWQYVLPNQRKSRVTAPADAIERRLTQMLEDRIAFADAGSPPRARLVAGDARKLDLHVDGRFDTMITSPPYPNNYDYADATRLEQTFWGEVAAWSDLHESVRRHLVRSSSQHTAKERLQLDDLLQAAELEPIRPELAEVCASLAAVRESKGGKKTYHTMVAAYFIDMAQTLNASRKVMGPGSTLCWVIGDSAPYGVHVPADAWLAKLAEAAGFSSPRFELLRDRNVKWKNRKHRVPLMEGRLWLRG